MREGREPKHTFFFTLNHDKDALRAFNRFLFPPPENVGSAPGWINYPAIPWGTEPWFAPSPFLA